MAPEAVQPLRINKMTAASSPSKVPRPLAELGSTERRRNSPSYNQATKKMIVSRDSSPFDASPFRSPRAFWGERDGMSPTRFGSENSPEREASPVPSKRGSIENLKKASRVANSPMFARENKDKYNPSSSPLLERPTTERMSDKIQQNVFSRYDSIRKENNPFASPDVGSTMPNKSPEIAQSQSKEVSPVKSSLTANSRYGVSPLGFDPESGSWSGEDEESGNHTPRGSLRPAKSVTFQTSPEVNEYEQQTPEPSSVASGSRESSYDDEEYEEGSFDRASSAENDDSFDASLEDTEKTPVVLPGDWLNTSPSTARTQLVDEYDDVFDGHPGSPALNATPSRVNRDPVVTVRSDSVASDGSIRPLPPLPDVTSPIRGRRSSGSLTAAAERASSVQRTQPSQPLPASVSKSEILRMREANMSLEDRMNLLALQESLANENQRSPSQRRSMSAAHETEGEEEQLADLPDFECVPKISRESILRKVKSDRNDDYENDQLPEELYDSPPLDYTDLANLDPDVPIPSRENSTHFDQAAAAIIIKEEEADSIVDLDTIPALSYDQNALGGSLQDYEDQERQSSVLHHEVRASEETDQSRYSSPMSTTEQQERYQTMTGLGIMNDETFATPLEEPFKKAHSREMSLPVLSNLGQDDFDFGLKSYMTPSPPLRTSAAPTAITDMAKEVSRISPLSADNEDSIYSEAREAEFEIPVVPERKATIKTGGKLKARPSGTPADLHSMIAARRQVSGEYPPSFPEHYREEQSAETESVWSQPSIAESAELSDGSKNDSGVDQAPARSTSNKLNLTLDLPTAELESGSGLSLSEEMERVIETQKVAFPPPSYASFPALPQSHSASRKISFTNESFAFSSPFSARSHGAAEHIGLSQFVPQSRAGTNAYIPTQKGYLMRQNTKVVVASSRNFSDETAPPMSPTNEAAPSFSAARGTRSAGSSPRKGSAGEKFIQTEPWNGKIRRKSSRRSSAARRSNIGGPTPPLPGMESALGVVEEYSMIEDDDEETERGRLFVKVVGVKELDIPLPRNDKLYFQLTLDNGLHCVTTANLDLGQQAPIGQEFELVVLNDLEFQLTLTTKLPAAPKVAAPAPASPTKAPRSPTKSVFSRLLSSPKKRMEKERKEREEFEESERRRHEEAERRRLASRPTPWDKLRELVDASSGSFARSYISLKSHEDQAFGRPLTVDVPLFNEWALEKDANVVSSVRSKRNMGNRGEGVVRRPPYTIGKLELQLFYVPRPKTAGDDDMPKSMSGAIREITAAEQVKEAKWEGCLSQQGGDCPYWRRRFFRLQGNKLTAYHEHTMQPRATINLAKASKLIDDKSSLMADPTSGNPSTSKRRKSAFAEEDDGYQFVEEGFRIRFANGETIDFYADNRDQKEEWMEALSQSVGKKTSAKTATWTDLVLARERASSNASIKSPELGKDAAFGAPKPARNPSIRVQAPSRDSSHSSNHNSIRSAPGSPLKSSGSVIRKPATNDGVPSVPPKDDGHTRPATPPMSPRTGHRDRKAVKSMIF